MFGGNNPPTGGFSFGGTSTPGSTASGGGGGFSFGGTPQPTSSSASTGGGFSFGASATSTPGFSFGGTPQGSTASTTPAPGGFSLGASTSQPASSAGFSLGGAATQPASSGGFSLGGATTQPASTGGFSLGGATTQPAPTGGFSLGGTSSQPPASSGGFSLGGTSTQPATSGFSLGGATTQPSQTPGFSLGGATQTSGAAGFNLSGTATQPSGLAKPAGTQPSTQPATGGFNLTAKSTAQPAAPGGFGLSTQPTLNLGGLTKTTQPVGAQPTGAQPTSTASTGLFSGGLKLGATSGTATTTQPSNLGVTAGFSQVGATTSATPALGGLEKKTATVGFSLPSSTAASTVTAAPQKEMSYQQLEENINKWMQDLEKQEKEFLEQATHVNAWDRFLVENGEKITCLNSDMERVKVEQQKLDHELDFIKSQQRELEEMLVPLEKSVEEQPNISFQQHADLERENTYQLAENVDAQLKRMLQDLKEIIDHLNTSNANQDNTDPIFQITQILNSHMDSLQWIDQNSAVLKRHVEDISKQMETQRKEQERNFRLVYN